MASSSSSSGRLSKLPHTKRSPEDALSDFAQRQFADSLKAKDKASCIKLLDESSQWLVRSKSRFEWLKDLIAVGLTSAEIVDLLIEDAKQSPWICYDLGHSSGDRSEASSDWSADQPYRRGRLPSQIDIGGKVAELCGLAGIIPTLANSEVWRFDAKVDSDQQCAEITYGSLAEVGTTNPSRGVFDQCIQALRRLQELFDWLQEWKQDRDGIVVLKLNSSSRVEASAISVQAIARFRKLLEHTSALNTYVPSYEITLMAGDFLRLMFDDWDRYSASAESICALAVQALCIATLSFNQAHLGALKPFFLDHPLSQITLAGVRDDEEQTPPLCFGLVNLTCAGDMVDSMVMVFTRDEARIGGTYDLYIAPEEMTRLWGPIGLRSCDPPHTSDSVLKLWLQGIDIRRGRIIKPLETSEKMHWQSDEAFNKQEGVPFILDMGKKIIIGAPPLVNKTCPIKPDKNGTVSRTNICSEIKELGTWPAKWELREKQGGLQGGQFTNVNFTATWIKSDARTRKRKGLEEVDLDFLNKPWGLLVSVCTGLAQRVALREVLAEVMLPMMDAWMDKTADWQTLMSTGQGVIEELKKPTFRDWFHQLDFDVKRALDRFVGHVLRKICWTGVNDADNLVVACPQFDDSSSCVHISSKDSRVLTWILKDTERSATFACLTNSCFIVSPWLVGCQNTPSPLWQNHVSALITSVCQYKWLGADDWEQIPRGSLQDGNVYWMSAGEDKRLITIGTHHSSLVKLTISHSSAPLRLLRRAWERIERIRETQIVELRENNLTMKDRATEFVIVYE
jgi:hypothetical protein